MPCAEYVDGGDPALPRRAAPRRSARLREALRLYDEGDRDAHIRHSGHEMATSDPLVISRSLQWLARAARAGAAHERRGRWRWRVASAHPFSLAQMLAYSAMLRVLAREWDAAEAMAAEAREVSTRYGILDDHRRWGTWRRGRRPRRGATRPRECGLAQEGMAALRRTGWQAVSSRSPWAHLALALGASGDAEAALAAAAEAVRVARANGELVWEAEALRVLAR